VAFSLEKSIEEKSKRRKQVMKSWNKKNTTKIIKQKKNKKRTNKRTRSKK